MKDEIFEVMYREFYNDFGSTPEYKKVQPTFCEGLTVDESNQKHELFVTAVDAECKQAFRKGFELALALL